MINIDLEVQKWYVVRTKSRAERKVAERLQLLGVENFLPMCNMIKQWHDRKKRVEEPLIKSFVFVKIGFKERHKVYDVVGLTNFLYVNGKIAEIKDEEIENLKIFCMFDDIIIEKENHNVGDSIEVISGELIGLKGYIKETVRGDFIGLSIDLLGFFASIRVNKNDVKVLKIAI